MTQELKPYCLYDLKGRGQYIAFGQYKTLLREIVFLKGIRGHLEKVWLKIQQLYPRVLIKDRQSLQHWTMISQALAVPIKGALFWQTNWYKATQFIGGIATDDRRFFVKAYKQPDDAALAKRQSDFINHYFGREFTIIPVMSVHDKLVFYPLLGHSHQTIALDDIEKRLIALNVEHMHRFANATKAAIDYANLNLPNLLQKSGHADLWKALQTYLLTCEPMPMVPVHGDVTPWNLFNSEKSLPVLVDYERAGWHVPFYDCWHLHCQPAVLKQNKPDLKSYIAKIATSISSDVTFLQQTALLYLLDQLAYDLQDKLDYPRQESRLDKTIRLKIALVQEILTVLPKNEP